MLYNCMFYRIYNVSLYKIIARSTITFEGFSLIPHVNCFFYTQIIWKHGHQRSVVKHTLIEISVVVPISI